MSTHTNEAPQASFAHGPFRVLRTLGAGGYATAVAAQDIPSNHLMCIKVFQKHNLKHKHTALSVSKELEAKMPLRPTDTSTEEQSPVYSATWYFRGIGMTRQSESSFAPQAKTPPRPADTSTEEQSPVYSATWYFRGIGMTRQKIHEAFGINALHELGIIHRDIKAENILIDVRENIRIADFGLSYLAADARPLDRQGAYSTNVAGTPYCMAPEILLFIQPRFYDVRTTRRLAIFKTHNDTLTYAAWCISNGAKHRQFSSFQNLKGNVGDLICGLLDPYPSWRYGFNEVSSHRLFLNPCGTSEFFDAYSCALKRSEVPESMPDL
ncbi:kinase-like domain-containing protein [Suillus occidentalis]|nr:kinase-like domain-containing protein [Suillus occidentalis]